MHVRVLRRELALRKVGFAQCCSVYAVRTMILQRGHYKAGRQLIYNIIL